MTNVLIGKLQLLLNKVARIITGTSYGTAGHPVLLKELEWLDMRSLEV